MTQPTARAVAEEIRAQLRHRGVSRADAAQAAGLNERQLRRRLEYETPFKAHEVIAIQALLGAARPVAA